MITISRRDQGFFHFRRQMDEDEVTGVIKVIFAAFIDHTDEIILLRLWVRDDFVLFS